MRLPALLLLLATSALAADETEAEYAAQVCQANPDCRAKLAAAVAAKAQAQASAADAAAKSQERQARRDAVDLASPEFQAWVMMRDLRAYQAAREAKLAVGETAVETARRHAREANMGPAVTAKSP